MVCPYPHSKGTTPLLRPWITATSLLPLSCNLSAIPRSGLCTLSPNGFCPQVCDPGIPDAAASLAPGEFLALRHNVDHNKLWKILKEMGILDHLTCLLRNLYAGQEATVRTGHGTTDWFQIFIYPYRHLSSEVDSGKYPTTAPALKAGNGDLGIISTFQKTELALCH